jgi:hypothetical protein
LFAIHSHFSRLPTASSLFPRTIYQNPETTRSSSLARKGAAAIVAEPRSARQQSGLEVELHLYPCQLDDIVVIQLARMFTQ